MLDLISFFTRIPCGKTSLEKAAKYSYLLPFVGILIGLIVGIFSMIFFHFIDGLLAGILTVGFLYILTGLNHLDGLADFADGLYTSGTIEQKIKAMKDVNVGIAGVTFVLFTLILLVYVITVIKGDISKIIVVEICAKNSVLFALFIGRPMDTGMGKIFIESLNKKLFPLSIIISSVVCFVLLQFIGLFVVLISIFFSFIFVKYSHHLFGAINGDILGTINEISRIIALFAIIVISQEVVR